MNITAAASALYGPQGEADEADKLRQQMLLQDAGGRLRPASIAVKGLTNV
jgi:hypothetical protein